MMNEMKTGLRPDFPHHAHDRIDRLAAVGRTAYEWTTRGYGPASGDFDLNALINAIAAMIIENETRR